MAPDPLSLIGSVVAEKYRVEAFVSEGGFAVVYRATHTIWNKPVALKLFSGLSRVPAEQRQALHQAFIAEGAFLSELCSETASVVQPRDVGSMTTPDGQWLPFMVLEWLEGENLDDCSLRERAAGAAPWTLTQSIALLAQVATALDVAHEKGIAHRDIKPSNLFLLGRPSRHDIGTVKILDFGVAKMMSEGSFSATQASTGQHVTSFTPEYGAPEQFNRAFGATGPWTDVYALALVAGELLSGRPAMTGEGLTALGLAAIDPVRRPTPRALGVELPDAVEAVFARALSVSPVERYARAGQFWLELEIASGMPLSVPLRERASRVSLTPLTPRVGPSSTTPPAVAVAQAAPTPRHGFALKLTLAAAFIATLGGVAAAGGGFSRGVAARVEPASAKAAAALALLPSAQAVAPAPPTCGDDMVQIPPGQFFMGSEEKAAPENEKPSHHVVLDSFCMDLHEVTAGAYKACADAGKCRRAPTQVEWPKITETERKLYSPVCTFGDPARTEHPINCVSWQMANDYCDVNGKRLPTEAEWEYATRGPDGRVYPWGDEEPTAEHLNACGKECALWGKQHGTPLEALYPGDDGFATTAPVGRFPKGRSRFGPYDVVGNVWEWTATWYGSYDNAASTNPRGPTSGERRVIRGGAFNGSYPSWLHPSFRYGQVPQAESHGIGFRCAAAAR
jgi:formylglycine-generating enzyme required for sulfatase activity/serine/threonine protein kinase